MLLAIIRWYFTIPVMRGGAGGQLVVSDTRSRRAALPLEPGVHHLPQYSHSLVELVDDGSVVLLGPVLSGHRRRGG